MPEDSRPQADIVDEAERLVARWSQAEAPVRLMGGLGVRLHVDGRLPQALEREYHDIDLTTVKGGGRAASRFLETMGYEPNDRFNRLHGASRLIFFDRAHDRRIDVFVGEFEMCHPIPVTARIDRDELSIPLAELLLTKLQIVELNQKDLIDIWALLNHHDLAPDDDDHVNADHVASLVSQDWGLWRTSTATIEHARRALESAGLEAGCANRIEARLIALSARIDREPKSMRWKIRAKVGERAQWWQDPAEVEG